MADENDVVEQVEDVDDLPETDDTDWQAEARKRDGIAKRYKTQAQKLKDELAAEKAKSTALAKNDTTTNKQGFDYAEKAYLKASGIAPNEYAFVEEFMRETGKSLDDALEAKYFQQELKELRSKEAVPSGTKRSTTSSRDTVDYWLAKGELPPADQRELRTKVVNAKIDRDKGGSHFTNNPVA